MFRSKTVLVVLAMMLALAVLASACAPAAPVGIKTSFEAAIYTNDSPAFTLMYPNKWVKKDNSNAVFDVASDESMTADTVVVGVMTESNDIPAAIKAMIDSDEALRGSKSKIVSQKGITLADGKTKATEVILSANVMIFDVYFYTVGLNTGGKCVSVVAYTLSGDEANKNLAKEIAQTLSVK